MNQNTQKPVSRDAVESSTRKGKSIPLSEAVMLMITLTIGGLMIARASGLLFQADDLRFLWWCDQRSHKPWKAFTDPSLFGVYYRPVLSLIFWLHYTLFGMNAFWHQIALGGWWMGIVLFLYGWGKRQASALAGFFTCLFFFSMNSSGQLLLWNSWLTSTCSIVMQLATLSFLYRYLQKAKISWLAIYFFSFLLACYTKESALFCLPFTSIAILLISSGSWKRKSLLFLLIGILSAVLYHQSPTFHLMKGIARNVTPNQILTNLAFFSQYLFDNNLLKILILLVIIPEIITSGKWGIIKTIIFALLSGLVWNAAGEAGLPPTQSAGLSFSVFVHILWFSKHLRIWFMPLIWFMVSFWPLALLPLFPAYTADAAVALSLVLGSGLYFSCQQIMEIPFPTRWFKPVLRYGLPIVAISGLFIFSLTASLKECFHNVDYAEAVYANPLKVTFQQFYYDLFGIRSWGPIYINPGERLGMETYIALVLKTQYPFQVNTGAPPPHAHRMEAYTRQNYHIIPDDDPLDIWLPEEVGPPPPGWDNDPYYQPEDWTITRVMDGDKTDGWSPPDGYTRAVFPYGEDYSFVRHDLVWSTEPQFFTYQGKIDPAWVQQPGPFVLTFWLESQRWEMIQSISLTVRMAGKEFRWDSITPAVVNTMFPWRRILLHEEEAQQSPETNGNPEDFQFTLAIKTKEQGDTVWSHIGIDEIRLAKRKEAHS